GRGPVEGAKNVQQGALAGAGRPHDGEGVAGLKVEANVTQDGERTAARGVVLAKVGDVQSHRRRGSGPQKGESAASVAGGHRKTHLVRKLLAAMIFGKRVD